MNEYLFAAYSLVWLVLFFYVWNLSRRQARLEKELKDLKAKVGGKPPSIENDKTQ